MHYYLKFSITRAKVAPVNLIYFSTTEATYGVFQNMEIFCRITIYTRGRHKSFQFYVEFKIM